MTRPEPEIGNIEWQKDRHDEEIFNSALLAQYWWAEKLGLKP